MGKEEIDRQCAAIDRAAKKVLKNKKTALAFLVGAGILTKTGKLTKRYR